MTGRGAAKIELVADASAEGESVVSAPGRAVLSAAGSTLKLRDFAQLVGRVQTVSGMGREC